jgi:hypothetical protein
MTSSYVISSMYQPVSSGEKSYLIDRSLLAATQYKHLHKDKAN